MSYILNNEISFSPSGNTNSGFVSILNSSATPLASGATYTGTYEDISNYASIEIIASTDVNGTLYYDFSTDGVNLDRSVQLSSGNDSSLGIHGLVPVAKYGRVRVVNGNTAQSTFRIQVLYHLSSKIAMPTSRMDQSVGAYSDVLNTRALLVGKTEGGDYYEKIASNGGHLEVSLQSPVSAFGELTAVEPEPVAQMDFVYGINNYLALSAITGSGTVSASNGLLNCSTTAASSSSAQLSSIRYIKYRPGQGAKGMFTALFTTGVADSNQYAGVFTPTLNNGFGFGYSGDTFGIWYMQNGSATHIPQTEWNTDLMNGAGGANNASGMDLDPTNGNVFKITYQYLGFGAIKFFVENSYNGQFTLVHEIKYTNSNTTPSVSQPSLSLLWKAENTSNTSNVVVKGASGALFLEGQRKLLGPSHGLDNNKSSVTTQTNIITLKNCTSYNGINNRSHIRLRTVSFASNTGGAGNGITTLKILRNPTVGGSPSFTTVNGTTADSGATITNGQSIVSYDTAGTTVTGGDVLFNSVIGVGNNDSKDLSELDLFAYPGDRIVFSITSTQSVTTGVGITWTEDI